MQTTLETLGALERRLSVAVPVADIEGEVEEAPARLARTVKVAGIPAWQGAAAHARPAIRTRKCAPM